MSIPRNTVLAFAPQGVMLLTGIVTSIVTARYLGPSGRGVLALALLAPDQLRGAGHAINIAMGDDGRWRRVGS